MTRLSAFPPAFPPVFPAVPAAPLATLALALVAGCGEDEPSDQGSSKPAPAQTSQASEGGCKQVEQPAPRADGGAKKPKGKLDAKRAYEVTLVTSCGELTFRLDVKAAPNTAASFVSLARAGFFDDTVFHRIVPGFVIQGGDPTGSGSGGPATRRSIGRRRTRRT